MAGLGRREKNHTSSSRSFLFAKNSRDRNRISEVTEKNQQFYQMLPKSISSDNSRRTATITSSADAFCAENRNQSQDQENEKQKFRTPRYVERRSCCITRENRKFRTNSPAASAKRNKKERKKKKRNSQLPATKPKTKPKKLLKNSSETAVSHAPDHRGNKFF